MQDFIILQQHLLGELTICWRERRNEKKREQKMPFIVATYVSACSPRAAYALRSDQFLRKREKKLE
jgi:hypothetical protein